MSPIAPTSAAPPRGPIRPLRVAAALAALLASLSALPACTTSTGSAAEPPKAPPAIEVTTTSVAQEPVRQTFRATGTLTADDQAEVSSEIAGRIVSTPIERGTIVAEGVVLVQVSSTETAAQLAEAEANAAQSAAALNLSASGGFDVERVPEVGNARAELSLAESEYARIQSLLEQKVVSQSEYDQRRTQVEAARQRLESARNAAQQRYRGYQASLARVTLARKALADTSVRAPFAGVVAERKVSTGDYVTKGHVVATVVRINPLRVELAIPEQDVSRIAAGQPISFRVDAYPDRRFDGVVRYVSPSLRSDQRAMMIEALVPNPTGELKPGLFATAEISEKDSHPALLVDNAALREVGNTRRALVVIGSRLEDRIVTVGQPVGDTRLVVTSGLKAGDLVALPANPSLADGTIVRVTGREPVQQKSEH